ncbi:DnaJ domain containing protein [Novymonas esmeraldas]|uniref:DnaJ domain containing protein n=1 Tax=Novymonas esmeraldas TaxID=1808958 RepID=A0AAW0F387_9TRYP
MHRVRRLAPAVACAAVRGIFQSKEFLAASKELPTTPEGRNPYDVLEITATQATTLDDVSKQFRSLVVKYHPDKPGGSTEKMAEVNLAYKIVKENHDAMLRRMREAESALKANEAYRQHKHARVSRDEELGRSGGLHRRNARAAREAADPASTRRARSLRDIEVQWSKFTEDTEAAVKSMCNRYELAIQQGKFFRKSATLNEITVRERWLRKSFLKGVWEDVHELRGELLRRGARSAQQSELAEAMVSFASTTQRKLNEDFQRLTQESVQLQSRMFVERAFVIVCSLILMVKLWRWFVGFTFNNTLTVKLKRAFLSQ